MTLSMKQKVGIGLWVFLIIMIWETVFQVHQTEQAIIFQFGESKRVVQDPGLHIKVPFIQNVIIYEKRLLDLDPESESVNLSESERKVLNVDSFTRYRIKNPIQYYEAVRFEVQAKKQLGNIINSSMRDVLGKVDLKGLLSNERTEIMSRIKKQVEERVGNLGIEIADVRIKRADLPEETGQAIYARMRSEQEWLAQENRAEGEEDAKKIRAEADRDRVILLAEAEKQAQILQGEGDAQAAKIWANAASKDPQFYAFYRSLKAYERSMSREDTKFILSPDSEFFRFFQNL